MDYKAKYTKLLRILYDIVTEEFEYLCKNENAGQDEPVDEREETDPVIYPKRKARHSK